MDSRQKKRKRLEMQGRVYPPHSYCASYGPPALATQIAVTTGSLTHSMTSNLLAENKYLMSVWTTTETKSREDKANN